MQININPINNNQRPAFRAQKASQITKLNTFSAQKADFLRENCKEVFSKLKFNQPLIEKIISNFENIKLTAKEVTFLLKNNSAIRLLMPLGATGSLFVLQNLENEKPQNTLILSNDNSLIESISLNDEEFKTTSFKDETVLENFVSKFSDVAGTSLADLKDFIFSGAKSDNNVSTSQKVQTKDIVPPAEKWHEYSMSEVIKQNVLRNPRPTTRKHNPHSLMGLKHVATKPKVEDVVEKAQDSVQKPKDVAVEPKKEKPVKKETKPKEVAVESKKESSVKKEVRPKEQKSKRSKFQPVSIPVVWKKVGSQDAGILDNEVKSKIAEIKNLYDEIRAFLDSKCVFTIMNVCNGFQNLTKRNANSLAFRDLKISFPQGVYTEDVNDSKMVVFEDLNDSYSIYVTESGKVLDRKTKGLDYKRFFQNPAYLSHNEIKQVSKDEKFTGLIDRTLANLREFKTYIDNQGWRVRKNSEIVAKTIGTIDSSLQEKVDFVRDKYDSIQKTLGSMSFYNSYMTRISYSNILVSAKKRIEFVNPQKDDKNILFSHTHNKFGEFYVVAKYPGGDDIEELFVLTPDGKMVKNLVKNRGLRGIFPTGGQATLKYYTNDELDVQTTRLQELLDVLSERFVDYENFISETIKKNEKIIKDTSNKTAFSNKKVPLEDVKSFFDKTVADMVSSINNSKEPIAIKAALDSFTDDLRSKFDDFLKQFQNK